MGRSDKVAGLFDPEGPQLIQHGDPDLIPHWGIPFRTPIVPLQTIRFSRQFIKMAPVGAVISSPFIFPSFSGKKIAVHSPRFLS